ncbi:hypothetical protein [Candidatus Palauibacter sp.]|uniref:hypothetical protein n=1 Tax=Candidatus Palauibacter sp. TaxID=3101350 RepID=UPI003B015D87
MEPLVATGTRSRRLEIKGFYERRHWSELLGLGTFITAADIERWRSSRVDHVVTNQVGGIVYKGPASLSAEFGGSSSRCGVVVVWTK